MVFIEFVTKISIIDNIRINNYSIIMPGVLHLKRHYHIFINQNFIFQSIAFIVKIIRIDVPEWHSTLALDFLAVGAHQTFYSPILES